MEAVVLPGLVMARKSVHPGYGVCTWPFKVGASIRHQTWDAEFPTDEELLIVENHGSHVVVRSSKYGLDKYPEAGFVPMYSWYYCSPVEREKLGFGKWFAEKTGG